MLAAGGVGAVAGVFTSESPAGPADRVTPPPEPLQRALERELALVADLDRALRNGTGPAALLRAVRADHVAHAAALRSSAAGLSATAPGPSATATSPSMPPAAAPTLARLRAAEAAAARATAADAAALTGADAALLASISACEATHGELLG